MYDLVLNIRQPQRNRPRYYKLAFNDRKPSWADVMAQLVEQVHPWFPPPAYELVYTLEEEEELVLDSDYTLGIALQSLAPDTQYLNLQLVRPHEPTAELGE
jgi:hypothetical protein